MLNINIVNSGNIPGYKLKIDIDFDASKITECIFGPIKAALTDASDISKLSAGLNDKLMKLQNMFLGFDKLKVECFTNVIKESTEGVANGVINIVTDIKKDAQRKINEYKDEIGRRAREAKRLAEETKRKTCEGTRHACRALSCWISCGHCDYDCG
eukprot:212032_1